MNRFTNKAILLCSLVVLSISTSLAAPKIQNTLNYGLWRMSASWDWNRVPATSDTIVVPANQVLIVDNPNTLGDVYIQVFGTLRFLHGKLTLGANSVIVVYPAGRIEGNSNSEKIRIGANEVFNGSDPDITGPSIANSSSGAGFTPFTLPVTFLEFTLTPNSKTVLLEWATTEELQAARFEIEVSKDGKQWSTLASLQAKGTFSGIARYAYSAVNDISPLAYYRIKEIDLDGRFMYSGVRVVKQQGDVTSGVSIGTLRGRVTLHFSKPLEGRVLVRILNMGGQTISRHYLNNVVGPVTLDTKFQVTGAVIVTVEGAAGRTSSQLLL